MIVRFFALFLVLSMPSFYPNAYSCYNHFLIDRFSNLDVISISKKDFTMISPSLEVYYDKLNFSYLDENGSLEKWEYNVVKFISDADSSRTFYGSEALGNTGARNNIVVTIDNQNQAKIKIRRGFGWCATMDNLIVLEAK